MSGMDAKTIVCSLMAALENYSLEELYSKRKWSRKYIMERGGSDDVKVFFEMAFEVAIENKKKELSSEKEGITV